MIVTSNRSSPWSLARTSVKKCRSAYHCSVESPEASLQIYLLVPLFLLIIVSSATTSFAASSSWHEGRFSSSSHHFLFRESLIADLPGVGFCLETPAVGLCLELPGVGSCLELPGVGSCWLVRPRPLVSARGTLRKSLLLKMFAALVQGLMCDPVSITLIIRNKLEVLRISGYPE